MKSAGSWDAPSRLLNHCLSGRKEIFVRNYFFTVCRSIQVKVKTKEGAGWRTHEEGAALLHEEDFQEQPAPGVVPQVTLSD